MNPIGNKKILVLVLFSIVIGAVMAIPVTATVSSADRSVSETSIGTNETVDITVQIQTNQSGGDVLLNDSFSGPIGSADGSVVDPAGGSVTSNVVDEAGSAILVSGADPNSTIEVAYNITSSNNEGTIEIVDGSDSSTSIGTTTIDVTNNTSPVASGSRTTSSDLINTSDTVTVTVEAQTNQNGDDVIIDEGFNGPVTSAEGRIVDAANGSVVLESVNNQGASFGVSGPDPNSNITAEYNITADTIPGEISIFSEISSDVSIANTTITVGNPPVSGNTSVDIVEVDGKAGGIQNPQPVTTVLDISLGTLPYPGAINESKLDIEVGNESVTSGITVDKRRPGVWALIFFAPTQSDSGTYDLNVSFDDPELGNTDNASQSDSIVYSSTGGVQASINLQLDASGSMGGYTSNNKMTQAKVGAQKVVTASDPDDYLSIVDYDYESTIRQDLVRKSGNETNLSNSISQISAGGSTNVGAAMQDGLTTLSGAPDGSVKAAIHMTDGKRNAGPSEYEIRNDIVAQYNSNDTCLYTVGFGVGADEDFMKDVANASTCGSYSFAAEEGDDTAQTEQTLEEVFTAIKGEVTGEETIDQSSGNLSQGDTITKNYQTDDSVNVKTVSVDLGDTPKGNISLFNTDPTTVLSGDESSLVSTSQNDQGTVRLLDPNGQIIADDSDQSIEISVVDGQVTYRIEDPESGQWTYEIVNEGSNDISYETDVSADTQSTLDVSTSASTYYETSSADVTGLFYGPNGNIEDANVEANVTQPDGSIKTITFSEINPGVYAAEVGLPQNGSYTIETTANKNDITRQQSLTVTAEELSNAPLSVSTQSSGEIDAGSSGTVDIEIDVGPNGISEQVDIGVSEMIESSTQSVISTSDITTATERISVNAGETRTITASVDVPATAADGVYNGTARVYRKDGSVVSSDVSIEVNNPVPAGAVYRDPTGPPANFDADSDGKLSRSEVTGAVNEYFAGSGVTRSDVTEVVNAYFRSQ